MINGFDDEFYDDFFNDPTFRSFFSRPNRQYQNRDTQQVDITKYFSNQANEILQNAAVLALSYEKNKIDTEHLLLVLLESDNYVIDKIFEKTKLDKKELISYLKDQIGEKKKTEVKEGKQISITPRLQNALQQAFYISRQMGQNYVGPEHFLLGLLAEGEGLAALTLKKHGLTQEKLRQILLSKLGLTKEGKIKEKSDTPELDKYGRDLTKHARQGKIDPVIGRDNEIERVIQILSRRQKNNPVLIGEPGVGKTAIAEGLAVKIINKDVPEVLENKRLVALDLTGMVAGSKYRGEFEERIKKVLDEIKKNKNKLIIFIDELHTIVGTGAQEGQMDVSNIIKPALARGELHTIGATTMNEYKKYIEKDAALERRFQPVIIKEPSIEETIEILRGLKPRYESFHKVEITDKAVIAATKLSKRYIADRFLPDKAIDLIDEAAAKVHLENLRATQDLKKIKDDIEKGKREIESAKASKNEELVKKLESMVAQVENKYNKKKEEISKNRAVQSPKVEVSDIEELISKYTGIPIAKLADSDIKKLVNLEKNMAKKIIGQDEAIEIISDAVRRARAGLKKEYQPIGTFLFLGPTGVGKTEMAKVLAEEVFAGRENIIRIDMSEYMEKHSVAKLIGSPPGYVGFEEGGQLTEKIRRNPYSLILLDEIEKAHSEVFNILLQLLDEGRLTDAKGRTVDFRNTIIIATSNIASDKIQAWVKAGSKDKEKFNKSLIEELKNYFRPEFLNRLDEIIVFNPLNQKQIEDIVRLQIAETKDMLKKQNNINLEVSQDVIKHLAKTGFDPEFGARPLKREIQKQIENPLSKEIISKKFSSGDKIKVELKNEKIEFSK